MYDIISNMTDRNDHNGALLEGARCLGLTKIVQRMGMVQELHLIIGYMPSCLSLYRNELYEAVMKTAEQKLSPEGFQAFHNAF